jgi:Ca-activated chloride channel family protein
MGRIQNTQGTPVVGAQVSLKGPLSKRTQTNAQGIYMFNQLKKGKYTLRVKAAGYQFVQTALEIKNASTRKNMTLKASQVKGKSKNKAEAEAEDTLSPPPSPSPSPRSSSSVLLELSGAGTASVQARSSGRRSSRKSAKRSRRPSNNRRSAYAKKRRPKKGRPHSMHLARPALPPPSFKDPSFSSEKPGGDEYSHKDDQPYKSPTSDPLSTFSIDVDTASYANLRRFIFNGQKPPKGAIRIEEMINYFTYDYIAPTEEDPHPFNVHTEMAPAPWDTKHQLLHIGLQGKRIDRSKLPPSNLVFLLDVSGSMRGPDRLPLLQQGLSLLIGTLRPQDRVSIVAYAGSAGVILPPTTGDQRQTILKALKSLRASGSTAGGQGIQLAYKLAQDHFEKEGNNRIILATDGDFNVGVSSQSALVDLIEEKRKTGIFLTVLGFGRGNYQDHKMSMLAEKGNGNYAYIDSLLEAQKVLVSEMGGTLFTIAKDVKIQVEFNPNRVKEYRLIGYKSRILAAQDFNDDKKDAGELGAGHSVTALYEIVPTGSASSSAGVDPLKYQKKSPTSDSKEWLTVKLRYKHPKGTKSTLLTHVHTHALSDWKKTSENFRFSAGVTALGMQITQSKYKGKTSWDLISNLVKGAKGADENGYRAELMDILKKAKRLYGTPLAK